MNKVLILPLVFLFMIGAVNAWGWTPDWDFLPDFDFQFPSSCNVDADCGTSTSCTALSCQVIPNSGGVMDCAVSYAPDGTYCDLPFHTCDGNGACVYVAPPVLDCNDNNACTNDYNIVTSCAHDTVSCDDGNAGTTDSCDTVTGCVHTPTTPPFVPCNDLNACTINDYMVFSVFSFCASGTPLICDDGDASTSDSCNIQTGCVYTPICTPTTEVCDGLDNDCNGGIDEDHVCCTDADNDLHYVGDDCDLDWDCNDANPNSWRVDYFWFDEDEDRYYLTGLPNMNDASQIAICYGENIPFPYTFSVIGPDCNDADWTLTTECGDEDPSVPEFGVIAGAVALIGALGIFMYSRK